jgi:hypothetical protein
LLFTVFLRIHIGRHAYKFTHIYATHSWSQIDFDFGHGFITNSAMDHVGVRWTGLIRPQYTETYTFITNSTGFGPRLIINSVELINELETEHGCKQRDVVGDCLWYAPSWKWNYDGSSIGVQVCVYAYVCIWMCTCVLGSVVLND